MITVLERPGVTAYRADELDRLCGVLQDLLDLTDIGDVRVEFPPRLDKAHARNQRRYADVDPETLTFSFATAVLDLAPEHLLGLLAHEVGHVLAWAELGEDHTEDDADLLAEGVLGVTVGYDRRWPSKGLQVALD